MQECADGADTGKGEELPEKLKHGGPGRVGYWHVSIPETRKGINRCSMGPQLSRLTGCPSG
jgi:hypothetical protein